MSLINIKMSVAALLIVALVGLALFVFWAYYKRRNVQARKEMYQAQDHEFQTSIMEELGDRILTKIGIAEHPNEHSQYLSNSRTRAYTQDPILDPMMATLVDKVSKVIVGKYVLDDPLAIEYLTSAIERAVLYLARDKDKEQIVNEYDPQFSNDLLIEACRGLYEYPHLDHMKKLLVGQYIINKTMDGDEIDSIYNYVTSLALNRQIPATTRMNAADVLSLSNSTRYIKIANQALDILRQEDDAPRRVLRKPQGGQTTMHFGQAPQERIAPRRLREPRERTDLFIIPPIIGRRDHDLQQVLWEQVGARSTPLTDRTVYEDGQNTHNTTVNESVLEAAKELVANYRAPGILSFNYNQVNKDIPVDQRTKIEASIHRITTDPSTFKHGTNLHGIFQALLQYIDQSEQKSELNTRLMQELIEMSSLCASGHMSRLLNVIQGFEIKPELKVKISIDDEIYASCKNYIEKALIEADNSDELMEEMTATEKPLLVSFLKTKIREWVPRLYQEYKDVADKEEVNKAVIKAMDKYTKTSGKFSSAV